MSDFYGDEPIKYQEALQRKRTDELLANPIQLAKENAALKEQVAQVRYTNAVVYGTSHPEMYKTEIDYAKETIAQQAEAISQIKSKLRVAVVSIEIGAPEYDMGDTLEILSDAEAIQPNPDILRERDTHVIANFLEREGKWMTNDAMLRERDARLAERIAEYVDRNLYSCREYADQIRKGEF